VDASRLSWGISFGQDGIYTSQTTAEKAGHLVWRDLDASQYTLAPPCNLKRLICILIDHP